MTGTSAGSWSGDTADGLPGPPSGVFADLTGLDEGDLDLTILPPWRAILPRTVPAGA